MHICLSKDSCRQVEKVEYLSISGGNAVNMVPDFCQAVIRTDEGELIKESLTEYLADNNVKLEIEESNDSIIINSYGISAHGSLPEKGLNAVSQLMLFLKTLDVFNDEIKDILNFTVKK